MIYIEGPRNTGKTYLLEHYLKEFPNKWKTHKFPFFDFYKELELEKDFNAANAFSFGKDLALFQLAKDSLLPNNIILDRGFISSIAFCKIFRNCKEEELVRYSEIVKNNFENIDIDIIFVQPDEEGRQRNNIDTIRLKDTTEMQKLVTTNETVILPSTYNFWYDWSLGLFKDLPNFRIHRFTNHFDEESVKQFNALINSIKF